MPRNCFSRNRGRTHRPASVLILTVFFILLLLAVVAFSVDLGYVCVSRGELQAAADATAHAAMQKLFDPTDEFTRRELEGSPYHFDFNQSASLASRNMAVPREAIKYSRYHRAGGKVLDFRPPDLERGYYRAPYAHHIDPEDRWYPCTEDPPVRVSPLFPYYVPPVTTPLPLDLPPELRRMITQVRKHSPHHPYGEVEEAVFSVLAPPPVSSLYLRPNSVRVRVHRDDIRNGPVNLFFARAMGVEDVGMEARATATFEDNVVGFKFYTSPQTGKVTFESWVSLEPEAPLTSKLLPFAMDVNTFGAIASGLSVIDLYEYRRKDDAPQTPYSQRVQFSPANVNWLKDLNHPNYRRLSPVKIPPLFPQPPDLTFKPGPNTDPNDPNHFNPFDPTLYEGMMPGDRIKEGLLTPLTVRRTSLQTINVLVGPVPIPIDIHAQQDAVNQAIHAGNFGTLYIGNLTRNSFQEFCRQLVEGPNAQDLASYPNGEFRLGSHLGDSIVNSDLKMLLESIKGQPRIIPLYRPNPETLMPQFTGPGTEVTYDIVGFGGITILDIIEIPGVNVDIGATEPVYNPLTGQIVVPATEPGTFLGTEKSIKILFQCEFVIDATAIGSMEYRREEPFTSRFIYRPLAITR